MAWAILTGSKLVAICMGNINWKKQGGYMHGQY